MTLDEYLTVAQVAELLGCHERTVRRHIDDGSLPALRLGGLTRIRRGALVELERPTRKAARGLQPARPRVPRGRFAQMARDDTTR